MVSKEQARVHKGKGMRLETAGNYFEAAAEYEKSIQSLGEWRHEEQAELRSIYTHRSACYERLEMYAEVVHDCTAALQFEGAAFEDVLTLYLMRSKAHERQEKYAQALDDVENALRRDPNSIQARRELGRLQRLNRDMEMRASRAHHESPSPAPAPAFVPARAPVPAPAVERARSRPLWESDDD
jgi:tetratricopeptide (TPR) repeat protein